MPTPPVERFSFCFEPSLRSAARLFGVTERSSVVAVGEGVLDIRYGPWHLRTPLANVRGATRTGPYSWWKVAGPAHLSLADRGVTFAPTTRGGVCIEFREPVPAIAPGSRLRHPAATVGVTDPDRLLAALGAPT